MPTHWLLNHLFINLHNCWCYGSTVTNQAQVISFIYPYWATPTFSLALAFICRAPDLANLSGQVQSCSKAYKVVRPPVAKHVKKHVKLGEGMSEIEKAILAEICADCSIRISQFPTFWKVIQPNWTSRMPCYGLEVSLQSHMFSVTTY